LTLMDKSFYRDMEITHLADTTTYCRSDRSAALSTSTILRAILQAHRQYCSSIYADGMYPNAAFKQARQVAPSVCKRQLSYCSDLLPAENPQECQQPNGSPHHFFMYPTSQYVDSCLQPYLRGLPSVFDGRPRMASTLPSMPSASLSASPSQFMPPYAVPM
jgi:hypothetical protein